MLPQSRLADRRAIIRRLWKNKVREPKKIATITHIPLSTVYRYVTQLKKTGNLSSCAHSGRPKIISVKQHRHLGQIVKHQASVTSVELATRLNKTYRKLNVSARTIRRELVALNYKVVRSQRILLLTPVHIETRQNWALCHLNDRWNQTIFSDEATFQMFRNTQLVRYKKGVGSRPQKAMVKHPYKVHVWAAFSAQGSIGFHIFTGTLTAIRYCEILTQYLFPHAYKAGRRWRFQHDNAPTHTAKITEKLLDSHRVRVIDWPANSPDLNPIENLWAILKGRVEKQVNIYVTKNRHISVSEFEQIIEKEWKKIDRNLYLKLANSMSKRLNDVIELKGKKTKY